MRFKAGSGDPGQFILQQATARGAQPRSTNGMPVISSSWKYGEDQHGVVVRLPPVDGAAVERLLQQAFGQPTHGPKDTPSGGRWAAYRVTPASLTIQFTSDDEGTEVHIVHWITMRSKAR